MWQKISDQPGRFLACFCFAPIIGFKGVEYQDWFLVFFAILLYGWDLYWIAFKKPCVS